MAKKIKNIVVTKLYNCADHSKWYSDRSAETDMISSYEQMVKLLEQSANQFCRKMDQFIVHTGDVSDIREAFVQDFFKIKTLWESEPCNILYLDADCLFVQPTDIFGKFDQFMMFNYTDPRSLHTEQYDFPHFFNCGVRYYPHSMSADVWDTGVQGFNNMDRTHWDEEQRIYNQMLWQQSGVDITTALWPQLAYQMLSGEILNQSDAEFNGMPIQQSHIVHCHGSRNSAQRLQTLTQLQKLSQNTKMNTWMRFGYRYNNKSDEKYYVDKQFWGVSKEDLDLQIRHHILKTGVCEAFNLELKENTHEES